jgi:MarR-like DNA-binding transcriptional regulator SgrR of sgrS sRNA
MWIHLLTLGLIDGAGVDQEVSTIPTNEVGRVYVRRGKKVLLFNTPQEADRYLAAEQAANEVIEKAQKTSRRARKRLKEKVYPAADSIDLIEIEQLSVRFEVAYDLPKMFTDQDYSELVRVAELLRQMQDEEEIELLLIA